VDCSKIVGRAKRGVPTITSTLAIGGHAALCPPYGTDAWRRAYRVGTGLAPR